MIKAHHLLKIITSALTFETGDGSNIADKNILSFDITKYFFNKETLKRTGSKDYPRNGIKSEMKHAPIWRSWFRQYSSFGIVINK